jgi:hypothetical protein
MVDSKTNQDSGAAAKAKELAIVVGTKTVNVSIQLGYMLGRILKISARSAGRKTKDVGKRKGRELEPVIKNLASSGSKKAKDVGAKSRPLLKELATMISVQAKNTIEHTKNGIKADMKATNASNLAKSSEELPEIIIKIVNLNESLAQEAREEFGIDCEAVEVNSLAIEKEPYYSYKLSMSPKIVTNRGCIKVRHKSFGLIQIIQRN